MAIESVLLKPETCYAPGTYNYKFAYDGNEDTFMNTNVGGSDGVKEILFIMPPLDSYGIITGLDFIIVYDDIRNQTMTIFEPYSKVIIKEIPFFTSGASIKTQKIIEVTKNFQGKVGVRFSATQSGVQPKIFEVTLRVYYKNTRNIKLGSLEVAKLYLGATPITKAYLGNTLIYE